MGNTGRTGQAQKLVRVCRVEEVTEGEPLEAKLDQFPPLAVYRVDGEYFVTDNICTHGSAMLSDGEQEGTTIICPFHEGGFDIRTGEATMAPCRLPLKTYQVHIEDGWVSISHRISVDSPR